MTKLAAGRATGSFYAFKSAETTDASFVWGAGHVTNVGIADLYDRQRRQFLTEELGYRGRPGDGGVTLAKVEMSYLAELRHPSELDVHLSVSHIGQSSFQVAQGLFLGGQCIGICDSVFVNMGPSGAASLSDQVRAALQRFARA